MNRSTLLLIVANVAMTSLAQIVLKTGMSAPEVARALAGGIRLPALVTVLFHPWVVVGWACMRVRPWSGSWSCPGSM